MKTKLLVMFILVAGAGISFAQLPQDVYKKSHLKW